MGWGEADSSKKPEAKNLCPFKEDIFLSFSPKVPFPESFMV
jgi:hypothetical protein